MDRSLKVMMYPDRVAPLAVSALFLACGLQPYDWAPSTTTLVASSSTTTGGTTSSSSGSLATSTTTGVSTGTSMTTSTTPASTGQGFIDATTGEQVPRDCDITAQDCPEGMKCTLDYYANDHLCVPVVPDPKQLGEPCSPERDGYFGLDDCDKGLFCDLDDWETRTWTCHTYCQASGEELVCPPLHFCNPARGRFICEPYCRPLVQDCPLGQVCISMDPEYYYPACWPDTSGSEGQAFDPCDSWTACDPGLQCLGTAAAIECDPQAGPGCCIPFCDLNDGPGACPGAGQVCQPAYPRTTEPGLAELGFCALPP